MLCEAVMEGNKMGNEQWNRNIKELTPKREEANGAMKT